MKTNRLTSFSLLATLVSCTPPAPESPTPEQLPDAPLKSSPTVTEKPRTHWTFSPRHNTNSYHSTTETVITQLDSSAKRRDSTHTTTQFTLEVDYTATSTNISGQITSVATNTSSIPHFPLEFSATISSGHFRLDPIIPSQAQTELCNTGLNQNLGEIRTAVYSLPIQLESSSTWVDSTSTTTCSGKGLPTILEILRSYKVIGESHDNGRLVLLLDREDQIRLAGQGAQEQHQLQLQGYGTATSRIAIDSRTGILIGTTTTQQLQLTITVSGRPEKFIQTSHQQVYLLH